MNVHNKTAIFKKKNQLKQQATFNDDIYVFIFEVLLHTVWAICCAKIQKWLILFDHDTIVHNLSETPFYNYYPRQIFLNNKFVEINERNTVIKNNNGKGGIKN